MRTCTSAAPASRSIRTSARWVLPRTIESSTTTSRLPRDDVAQRVELEPDAELADGLRRLDERAPDVGVLDQALAVGDAGLLRVADRGRRAGLGHRDDQVGLDRVLAGPAGGRSRRARRARRGRRSWCRGGPGRRTRRGSPWGRPAAKRWVRRPCSSIAISSPGSTSRTNEAPTMSSAAVSLATTQPRSSRPSTSGRMPCGSRAAYSVVSSMKTRQNAPRSSGSTSSAASSSERSGCAASSAVTRSVSLVASGVATPSGSSPRASAARAARRASSPVLIRLPLWPSASPPVAGGAEGRLGVLPDAGAGGGVAGVADGEVAAQGGEGGLVEDLRDQAHVLVDDDAGGRR